MFWSFRSRHLRITFQRENSTRRKWTHIFSRNWSRVREWLLSFSLFFIFSNYGKGNSWNGTWARIRAKVIKRWARVHRITSSLAGGKREVIIRIFFKRRRNLSELDASGVGYDSEGRIKMNWTRNSFLTSKKKRTIRIYLLWFMKKGYIDVKGGWKVQNIKEKNERVCIWRRKTNNRKQTVKKGWYGIWKGISRFKTIIYDTIAKLGWATLTTTYTYHLSLVGLLVGLLADWLYDYVS